MSRCQYGASAGKGVSAARSLPSPAPARCLPRRHRRLRILLIGGATICLYSLALLITDTTIAGLLEAAGNGDVIHAGAVGTGLGYTLLQLGVAHGDDGREPLSPGVAGIPYGFEPITAIIAAALWLRQPISAETTFFSCAFLMLAFSAGAVLKARMD